MTKKDYIIIAGAINAAFHRHGVTGDNRQSKLYDLAFDLVDTLSNEMQLDNPRFDRVRFIEAAYKEKFK